MRTEDLILYRQLPQQGLYEEMAELMENPDTESGRVRYLACVHQLIDLAGRYGFQGNLWHTALAFLIANHENPFSAACEIVGVREGSINQLARQDFRIMMDWFSYPLERFDEVYGTAVAPVLTKYINVCQDGHMFNKRVRDRLCVLAEELAGAKDAEEFFNYVTGFYKEYGVGKLGLHKAFRVVHNHLGDVGLEPVTCTEHTYLDRLVGYEIQKKKLVDNTRDFVEGLPANNVLLFGDAGTGKSSSVKAVLNEYYGQGLRMIEVYKHQFKDLPEVIGRIKNRAYKFIIYMDDLSFEEFEIEYKYLKAVIEGGLEKKPDNVLIYATSNRRHLVRESFSDVKDYNTELHTSDTVQEKLSLANRFGVSIYFGAPEKSEFQAIVRELAHRAGVCMEEERLFEEANKWELFHGGMTGRTAEQFVNYIKAQEMHKN